VVSLSHCDPFEPAGGIATVASVQRRVAKISIIDHMLRVVAREPIVRLLAEFAKQDSVISITMLTVGNSRRQKPKAGPAKDPAGQWGAIGPVDRKSLPEVHSFCTLDKEGRYTEGW